MVNGTDIMTLTASILQEDSDLMSLAGQRIFTGWSTTGQLPRVSLGFDFDPSGTGPTEVRSGALSVDIFTDGREGMGTQQQIRRRIVALLDDTLQATIETGNTLRYRLGSEGTVQDEDPQVVHWTMTFNMRFFRAPGTA